MQRQKTGVGLIVAVAVSLGLLVTGAQAQSGNLEPPPSAGDGAGDPAATTQTQPSWDQSLPVAERYVLIRAGGAVLDKNTGLVWQQAPFTGLLTWSESRSHCFNLRAGFYMGWRLPSIHELATLVIPGIGIAGPFSNVQPGSYWSETTDQFRPGNAWIVNVSGGRVTVRFGFAPTFAWCVRRGGPFE